MVQDLTVNLANSSVAELEQLSEEIKNAIEERKIKEINDARIHVRELAESLGITLEELIAEPNKPAKAKKKATVKFRNAHNQTWTGRGKKPKWLVLALQNGAKLEDFLIPASTEE